MGITSNNSSNSNLSIDAGPSVYPVVVVVVVGVGAVSHLTNKTFNLLLLANRMFSRHWSIFNKKLHFSFIFCCQFFEGNDEMMMKFLTKTFQIVAVMIMVLKNIHQCL